MNKMMRGRECVCKDEKIDQEKSIFLGGIQGQQE